MRVDLVLLASNEFQPGYHVVGLGGEHPLHVLSVSGWDDAPREIRDVFFPADSARHRAWLPNASAGEDEPIGDGPFVIPSNMILLVKQQHGEFGPIGWSAIPNQTLRWNSEKIVGFSLAAWRGDFLIAIGAPGIRLKGAPSAAQRRATPHTAFGRHVPEARASPSTASSRAVPADQRSSKFHR